MINKQFGTYLSLLPFTPQVTGITLKGVKYPLENAILNSGISLGISNEIVDDRAEIMFQDGILLGIESRD